MVGRSRRTVSWGSVKNTHSRKPHLGPSQVKETSLVGAQIVLTVLEEDQQALADQTNDRAKASEVENAIKAHIKVKLEEDPEYYQSLSLHLQEIIQKCENRWEQLVQQLLLFRDGMEQDKTDQSTALGLTDEEGAFYRVLMREVT